MTDSSRERRVIPARTVRRLDQSVLVDCGSGSADSGNKRLTIVPLVDGDLVAGLEIRCTCGASAVIECLYDAEETS